MLDGSAQSLARRRLKRRASAVCDAAAMHGQVPTLNEGHIGTITYTILVVAEAEHVVLGHRRPHLFLYQPIHACSSTPKRLFLAMSF